MGRVVIRRGIVSLSVFLCATQGWALGSLVNVGDGSARLGAEFRAEYIHDDQGITKRDGYHPGPIDQLQVSSANVLLSGSLDADTEYGFRFNLLNVADSPLEYGYGTHWATPWLGVSFGKERVLQGGWHHLNQGYRTHADGIYARNLTFPDYAPAVAIHLRFQGLLTLQAVNDVIQDSTDTLDAAVANRWNKEHHPTWIVSWLGSYGPIRPLLIFGSYDNNKSRYVDAGLRTSINGINATLDYHNDSVSYRMVAGVGESREDRSLTDTKVATTFNVSYQLRNIATPWVFLSIFERKQATDEVIGLVDRPHNQTAENLVTGGGYNYVFDDNGTVLGIGVDGHTFGRTWNPFIAYTATWGKFLKSADSKEVVRRQNDVLKIGVLATI